MKLADPSLLKDKCLVDGKWVGEGTRPIANPATGEVLAKTPRFGEAETIDAIEAAQRAFGPWAKRLPKDRAQVLRRWFDLIIANRDDIALIMTSEQGKPLAEARGEVDYAAAYIEFFGEEAKRIYGEINPTFRADSRIVVIKQPIGVVAPIASAPPQRRRDGDMLYCAACACSGREGACRQPLDRLFRSCRFRDRTRGVHCAK